ncbi:MAG TPA: ABC transporter permease [Steroidobacteraceae bacterium]|nr:ABC transporter permease [Steroidobacteraceae bacterium]
MNSMALESNHTSPATNPASRALGAYLTETRFEFMRMVRNPNVAIPVLILPMALYALFALLIAGEAIDKDANLGIYLFSAFSLMAVTMPALFGTGVTLALERDMGLLRLKRAQPAPHGAWVVAKILCGLALAILAYTPIVVLALLTGKLQLAPGQVVALSGALLVGTIPFCALGLMIGSLVSGTAAPGYANLIYLPGCYLSGMFFPLPKSMYWQAPIWPQFHVEQFVMHAAGITKFQYEPLAISIAVMIGYTVLFAGVVIYRLARKG